MQTSSERGQYDVRRGAAAYSPIISVFGSLAVPAIVVLFTIPSDAGRAQPELVGLAIGLLVVGLFGSLLGAIGLSAIGAEREATANLIPAIMLICVPVALSVAGVLGAFEVLAELYVPTSKGLFAFILAVGGLFGVIFNAAAIADAPGLGGPVDEQAHVDWQKEQWPGEPDAAVKKSLIVMTVGTLPIVLGMILRFANVTATLGSTGDNIVIGTGIVLAAAGTIGSLSRTIHVNGRSLIGLRGSEAYGSNLVISLFVLLLLVTLP